MKIQNLSAYFASLTLIAIVFVNSNYKKAANIESPSREVASVATPILDAQAAIGPVRNIRFTLFDAGIRPRELRIKAGLVNIHLEDRTNTSQPSQGLTIIRVSGSERVALGTVQRVANQLRGRSSFRLSPGEYEVFDAGQPANKAVLLVEP